MRREGRQAGSVLYGLLALAICADAQPAVPLRQESNSSALTLDPDALRFHRYDVEDGLAHNTVRAIAQDGDGYIWIATRGGLNRFDGQTFRTYRFERDDPHSLPDNDVRALATSAQGDLWIGTASGGLAHYDAALDRFDHYGMDNGLATNTVRGLHFDTHGELWITCSPQAVQHFDRARGRAQDAPFGRPVALASVYTYLDLPDDTLGLVGGGNLWRWNRHGSQLQPLLQDPAKALHASFEVALRDHQGDFWIALLPGDLLRLDAQGELISRHATGAREGLRSGVVQGLLETRDGRLWVATFAGIAVYDRASNRFVERWHDSADATSPPEQPNVMFEDRAGLLWVGSWQGGVAVHDPQGEAIRQYHQRLPTDEGLPGNLVRAILPEADGSLWLALQDAGVVHFQPGRGVLAHYRHEPNDASSLASDQVAALARSRDGTLWVGLDSNGMDRLQPGAKAFAHYRNDKNEATSLPADMLNALYMDGDDTLWVGSDGGGLASLCAGCARFRPEARDGDSPLGTRTPTVNAIVRAPDGAIWFGSYGRGLTRMESASGTIERYTTAERGNDAPSNDVVRTLHVDAKQRLWIGTASGLDQAERDPSDGRVRFRHYRGVEWSGKDNIVCILDDATGALWLATSTGLFRFDPANGEIADASVLGRGDRAGYFPNACVAQDGRLFFGGSRGLTVFAPEELPAPQPVGPLVLDEVSLFNTPVRPQPDRAEALLRQSLSRTRQLVFDYHQSVFGFSFSALDFRGPESVRYRYRMDGLNDAWLPVAAGQRYVGFSALPAGDYQFRVEARRGTSRSEASVAVRVLPPPWRSHGAYALYALSLAALIAFIAWRTRARIVHERNAAAALRTSEEALRRLNEELEQRVSARTIELSDSNAELTHTLVRLREAQQQLVEAEKLASLGGLVAGVAHEINTPLGVSVTAASYLQGETQRVQEQLSAGALTRADLDAFARTARDSADLLLRNLQHAGSLVQSFKRVAVEEASQEQCVVELGACLQDIMAMLGPSLKKTPHRIALEQSEPITLKVAPGALYQILTNLVANSLLHAFPSGHAGCITLRIAREADAVVLEYRDDGCGMSEQVRAHVFEPFFTTMRGQGGTGLGLHIVYNLVTQALKGRIRCDSALGQGTTFEIRLPTAA